MFSVDELIFQRNADTNALLSVDELVHVAGGLNSLQFESGVSSGTTIPVAVGGFAQGTTNSTLSGLTLSQMFDRLLFPTVNPTRNDANVSLSSLSSLLVIGSTHTFNLVTSVDDGEILLSSAVQSSNFAGDITSATLTGNLVGSSTVNLTFEDTQTVADHTVENYTIVEGSNKVTFTVAFDTGPMPLDSTGADLSSLRFTAETNGTRTAERTITGVYPLFVGTSTGDKSQLSLVQHTANNITCAQPYAETSTVRHRLFIPLVMFELRTWVVQTLNTVSNQFETGNQAVWTISGPTVTVEGQGVLYKLYTKTGALSGSNTYRFAF